MSAEIAVYRKVERRINNGDILLFKRGNSWFSRLISVAGRSEYSHAGSAGWLDADDCERFRRLFPNLMPGLYCAHTVEGRGGCLDRLEDLVKKYPGKIKVRKPIKRVKRRYNRKKTKRAMLQVVGKPYGWMAIKRASLTHLPFIRVALWAFMAPFVTRDDTNGSLPFCSMAVSRAARHGGLDPVPNLADGFTEPGDLDRSAIFEDFCFLYFDELPEKEKPKSKSTTSVPRRLATIVGAIAALFIFAFTLLTFVDACRVVYESHTQNVEAQP